MRLPAIRAELADALLATIPDAPDSVRRAAVHLRAAELYWVSAEMTRVSLDASTDLPDWTPAAALPAAVGLLVWEQGTPAMPARSVPREHWPTSPLGVPVPPQMPIDAILWAQHGGRVHLTALTRVDRLRALVPGADEQGVPRVTLWPLVVVEPIVSDEVITVGDMVGPGAGLVALLGATWIMMQQPTVATGRRVTPTQPGAARLPGGQLSGVTIIDLRRLDVVRDDVPDPDDAGRVYRHRWVVRGHWRQQAHGPHHSQRRPVWVPSHVKGPPGAPLLATEHVHVWRR